MMLRRRRQLCLRSPITGLVGTFSLLAMVFNRCLSLTRNSRAGHAARCVGSPISPERFCRSTCRRSGAGLPFSAIKPRTCGDGGFFLNVTISMGLTGSSELSRGRLGGLRAEALFEKKECDLRTTREDGDLGQARQIRLPNRANARPHTLESLGQMAAASPSGFSHSSALADISSAVVGLTASSCSHSLLGLRSSRKARPARRPGSRPMGGNLAHRRAHAGISSMSRTIDQASWCSTSETLSRPRST